MREKLMRFMQGRYGVDSLSRCLTYLGLIIFIIDSFVRTGVLQFIGIAVVLYSYYRIFSKDYQNRTRENKWFLHKTSGIRGLLLGLKNDRNIRKTHHIYTCKSCKQRIRIPKGKGKIMVTCPKCKTQFVKKS